MNIDPLGKWKQAAKAGKPDMDARLFKEIAGAVVRVADDASAPVTVILSTAAVDRMDDTIAVEGWQLDNYRKNPVVLFAHDQRSLPIGKMANLRVEEGKLLGDVTFAEHEFAKDVAALVRGGFLNAGSVGFRPIRYVFNEERGGDGWCPPCDFIEQELLEHSLVPVPANPEALLAGKAAGVDGPLLRWAERVLSHERGAGLWLPQDSIAEALRGQAEATWKALRPPVVTVPVPKADDPAGDEPMACACGAMPEAGDKFCSACGKELPVAPAKDAPTDEPDGASEDEKDLSIEQFSAALDRVVSARA
jgi:HK97 family phage prohead protease